MLAEDAPPKEQLLERSSSGSSGAPVKLFFDPLKELPRRLQELRLLTSHGYKLWQKQLVFDHPGHLAPKPFLPQRLGLWRRTMFPAWMDVHEAIRQVNGDQPHVLHGVLSSLRMLSLAVKAGGGLGYAPTLIVSKGELLDSVTRSLIETNLRAPLVDYYATEETGIIAWQCPTGEGYHIDQDFVHVETLTPEGEPTKPGEVGEICLTNLYMRAMPFIRYRVGDLGSISPDPCSCGRGLPLLKGLHGRRVDLILTPTGEIHHPFALMVLFEEVAEVKRYRLQQVSLDKLIARVNWLPGTSAEGKTAAATKLKGLFRERLGPSVTVDVEEVPEFTHGMGEKFPLVQGLGRSAAELASKSYNFRF
jgi:phenylacetate-CoA ligase